MKTTATHSSFEVYLSQVRGHALLGKKGELELAAEIELHEVAVWNLLLSYKPAAKLVARELSSVDIDLATASALDVRNADRERVVFDSIMLSPRWSKWPKLKRAVTHAAEQGHRARMKFMRGNLRLVVNISSRFKKTVSLSSEDLVQEGNLGLIKAIDKYDYHLGFRFSTYATWWIKHSMQRACLNTQHTVRRPVHIQEIVQKIMRAQYKITSEKKREATEEEVAEMLDVPVSKIRSVRLHVQAASMLSLDVGGDDEDSTPLQLASLAPSPLELLMHDQQEQRVSALLATLKPIQADILRKRYGIGNDGPTTLSKIGRELGLSRERIRQIQNEALDNLRASL